MTGLNRGYAGAHSRAFPIGRMRLSIRSPFPLAIMPNTNHASHPDAVFLLQILPDVGDGKELGAWYYRALP